MIFVGDDWAEAHHDVCVMVESGTRVAAGRFDEGAVGMAAFHALMAEHCDDPSQVVIGIETDRGLWVHALIGAGYRVYAINPKSVARYRDRHSVSGAKSDAGDAKVLADLVRTDRHNHRPVAGDSSQVEGVKVLARAHQTLIRERTRHTNQMRNALREYYPAALTAFRDLADRDTLVILGRAPTPQTGRGLTKRQIEAALKQGGRKRNLPTRTDEIHAALQAEQLAASEPISRAFGAVTVSMVSILTELNRQIGQLETELDTHFEQHPDAVILRSLPGVGVIIGARVLGEFGDDPNRYTDAKSRKNYAGTSPITRASGKSRIVAARYIKNERLTDATTRWAFCALTASPGPRAFYDEHRAKGNSHHQALRALANRLVGILHGCLRYQATYNEHTACGLDPVDWTVP